MTADALLLLLLLQGPLLLTEGLLGCPASKIFPCQLTTTPPADRLAA